MQAQYFFSTTQLPYGKDDTKQAKHYKDLTRTDNTGIFNG